MVSAGSRDDGTGGTAEGRLRQQQQQGGAGGGGRKKRTRRHMDTERMRAVRSRDHPDMAMLPIEHRTKVGLLLGWQPTFEKDKSSTMNTHSSHEEGSESVWSVKGFESLGKRKRLQLTVVVFELSHYLL
jgi:hypothetical protein